jgi:hypothetical protein
VLAIVLLLILLSLLTGVVPVGPLFR